MIAHILIYSRAEVERSREFILSKKIPTISIIDTGAEAVFKPDTDFIHTTYFDDVERPIERCTLMSSEQAETLIRFVIDIQKSNSKEFLVVHCTAGICRSGAVGTFLVDALELNYDTFKKSNPQILPNTYVKNLLYDVWIEKYGGRKLS